MSPRSSKSLFKAIISSSTVACCIVYGLHCRAQGIVGAPPGTGRGDYYAYNAAQLYEQWKFAPMPAFLITSSLAALLWMVYYKRRKSATNAMFLLAGVTISMTALVVYMVDHLQEWSVAYQISQYEPPRSGVPRRF
ncbi:MAG: hypothetical protein JST89_19255 [Cyanobacteria bacterium SZAS-4]|nr:hypothetical protein [Cyanobacteria bacterium SZAS-4]